MLECDHCLLEISEKKAIFYDLNGRKKVFCCHGCRGIYSLINEEELGEFYERRDDSWVPGPPDDRAIETSAFKDILRKVGNQVETDMILDGIRCASCVWLTEKILGKTDGVISARVNYATHKARICWSPEVTDISKILMRIKSIGYTPKPFVAKAHEEQMKKEERVLLIRLGTAAFFSMQLMLFSIALYAGYFQGMGDTTRSLFQVLSLFLTTPVLFYSGWPFLKGFVSGVKNLTFNMDVLIVTGAGSAYFYSIYNIFTGGEVYFDTSAMIITLILLGRYIETGAKGRASEVITKLLSLNPKEARLVIQNTEHRAQITDRISENQYRMVPVSTIKTGYLIHIKPGERVPLDGIVIEGSTEIDESMLTGESVPVPKQTGSEVFCGTQNLYGSFLFEVKRTGEDMVLSQIIKTVEDAQARRAPVQALADRVVGYFVPTVMTLSIMTAAGWFFYNGLMAGAVMNAVSVLVIACPCALGLATPLAILIGTTRAASRGILIKGGDIIERAKDVNTVVLDKTGTITEGRQELKEFKGVGLPGAEALCLASSLERLSEHSIGKAIADSYEGEESYSVTGFTALPGKGVKGDINGKAVLIGNRKFIEAEGVSESLDKILTHELLLWIRLQEDSGYTVVYLSHDSSIGGVFVISDRVRKEAGEAVRKLMETGSDVIMITGDNREAAVSVAKEIGITEDKVMAQKTPTEKAEAVKDMQDRGRHVIMVGDGINDAPALVQADIGIAMGRATDIALESADMVLMRNDLRLVSDAVSLSGKIYAVIRQNLFWAFIYNIIALPLAVAGMLHPIIAAVSMTFSSLSVVGNSMRLKRG